MYKVLFDIYGKIPPNNLGMCIILRYILSFLRFIVRKSEVFIMKYHHSINYEYKNINKDIVVSLTSFPKRLDTLWLTIRSMKCQTILPSKIVLYLLNSEVSWDSLPKSIVNEVDDIFEIRFRDGEFKAHGKYHFAMKDYPNSCIVTIDDDMIYPYDTIESLWNAHVQYPNFVITNNTHQVQMDNKSVNSYSEWQSIYNSDQIIDLPNLIPMGVGGALYPPHVLYKDALNFELAKKLSYFADDLWLYAMIKLGNKRVIKSKFNSLRIMPIDIANNVTLSDTNNGENQNDVQFNNIRTFYLSLLKIDIVD